MNPYRVIMFQTLHVAHFSAEDQPIAQISPNAIVLIALTSSAVVVQESALRQCRLPWPEVPRHKLGVSCLGLAPTRRLVTMTL